MQTIKLETLVNKPAHKAWQYFTTQRNKLYYQPIV